MENALQILGYGFFGIDRRCTREGGVAMYVRTARCPLLVSELSFSSDEIKMVGLPLECYIYYTVDYLITSK